MDFRAYSEPKFCLFATKSTTYLISWMIYVDVVLAILQRRKKLQSRFISSFIMIKYRSTVGRLLLIVTRVYFLIIIDDVT